MSGVSEIRIVDVTDEATFELLPPCADPEFDHRTCDYWEDADRGSKAHRANWLPVAGDRQRAASSEGAQRLGAAFNPFAPPPRPEAPNPFAPSESRRPFSNPFADEDEEPVDNPFAPKPKAAPTVGSDAPRKLNLLGRGLRVFGSYAKVLLVDGRPAGYSQFGPLSAYPRALRLRELYPQLPEAPLPAVITCIATTAEARDQGHARRLIQEVCEDLAKRGFSAVEAYPEARAQANATSAASPGFWEQLGFARVVADERYPVYRLELG